MHTDYRFIIEYHRAIRTLAPVPVVWLFPEVKQPHITVLNQNMIRSGMFDIVLLTWRCWVQRTTSWVQRNISYSKEKDVICRCHWNVFSWKKRSACSNLDDVSSKGSMYNKSVLIQVMVWRLPGNKPVPVPTLNHLPDDINVWCH